MVTALVFLGLIVWWAIDVYTNWLWFDQLGLLGVYTKILFLRLWLFVGGTLVSAIALSLSLYLAMRLSRGQSVLLLPAESQRLLQAMIVVASVLTVLTASPIFGAAAAERWQAMLLFFNKVSFGVADPHTQPPTSARLYVFCHLSLPQVYH